MEQLYSGIHSIRGKLGSRWLTQYLFVGERILLLDTGVKGSAESDIYPYMQSIGVNRTSLDYVVNSHADVDHFGDNAAIRRDNPQAIFLCHSADKAMIEDVEAILKSRYGWYAQYNLGYSTDTFQWLRDAAEANVPIDIAAKGDQWIRLSAQCSLQIMELPGHTMGHLGLWDPANGAAFVSDAVMGKGLVNRKGALISPPPYFSVSAYRNTIQKLLDLNPKALFTAHYLPFRGKRVHEFLMESFYFMEELEEQILNVLESSPTPLPLSEITEKVNACMGPFSEMKNELAGPVLAHLKDLMSSGKVVCGLEQGEPLWTVL